MTPEQAIAPQTPSAGLSCPYTMLPRKGNTMGRRDLPKTIAIKAAQDAKALWTFHVKQCAQCTGSVRDDMPKRICDEGWPLASAEAKTRVGLDRLRAERALPAADVQPELF